MDYRDRDRIDHCRNEISPLIDMTKLWPQLLHNNVFDNDDVNVPTWTEKLTEQATVSEILETIKTRGPRAFQNLLLSLRETGHRNIADKLEKTQPLPSNRNVSNYNSSLLETKGAKPITEDWYTETDFMTTEEPLVINVKHATKFMDNPDEGHHGKYVMRSKPHGYVLIISIQHYITEEQRTSALYDKRNLTKLFEDMGFDVTVPDPPAGFTGAEINRIIRDFSKRDFNKVDSCFVIISAHGGQGEQNGSVKSVIKGIDHAMEGAEEVFCDDIIDMFTVENCPLLRQKPKVFIFQACRGGRKQEVVRHVMDGGCEDVDATRNYSDILVVHSTMRGHVAYRDCHNGSWFIQALCEVFMRFACTMHIQDLFNQVDVRLKRLRTPDGQGQTPSVNSLGFSRHLYLNPGIFDE